MDAGRRFGRNLAAARERAKLTQEQLWRRCDVHPTEISRMEHGERDVRISTIYRLAEALQIRPGELLDHPD